MEATFTKKIMLEYFSEFTQLIDKDQTQISITLKTEV